jgi:hypothetical protein
MSTSTDPYLKLFQHFETKYIPSTQSDSLDKDVNECLSLFKRLCNDDVDMTELQLAREACLHVFHFYVDKDFSTRQQAIHNLNFLLLLRDMMNQDKCIWFANLSKIQVRCLWYFCLVIPLSYDTKLYQHFIDNVNVSVVQMFLPDIKNVDNILFQLHNSNFEACIKNISDISDEYLSFKQQLQLQHDFIIQPINVIVILLMTIKLCWMATGLFVTKQLLSIIYANELSKQNVALNTGMFITNVCAQWLSIVPILYQGFERLTFEIDKVYIELLEPMLS